MTKRNFLKFLQMEGKLFICFSDKVKLQNFIKATPISNQIFVCKNTIYSKKSFDDFINSKEAIESNILVIPSFDKTLEVIYCIKEFVDNHLANKKLIVVLEDKNKIYSKTDNLINALINRAISIN